MQGELDFSSAGSPPRMREKRPLMALGRELNRITPAYAGKTKSSLLNLVVVQDHPRVCGKNHFKSLISNLVAGSPPRMREKPKFKNAIRKHYRITPAYAGKTFKEWICNNNTAGSPPRMREKQKQLSKFGRLFRITPAYAGKTY